MTNEEMSLKTKRALAEALKKAMERKNLSKRLYNKSWGKEQKNGQSKPNQVK